MSLTDGFKLFLWQGKQSKLKIYLTEMLICKSSTAGTLLDKSIIKGWSLFFYDIQSNKWLLRLINNWIESEGFNQS